MSRHNTYLIKYLSPCSRLISDVARRRLLFSLVNDIQARRVVLDMGGHENFFEGHAHFYQKRPFSLRNALLYIIFVFDFLFIFKYKYFVQRS